MTSKVNETYIPSIISPRTIEYIGMILVILGGILLLPVIIPLVIIWNVLKGARAIIKTTQCLVYHRLYYKITTQPERIYDNKVNEFTGRTWTEPTNHYRCKVICRKCKREFTRISNREKLE